METLTLIAPQCACCTQPQALLPRDDLQAGLAVCPQSGALYRPEGAHYVPAAMPPVRSQATAVQSIQIDLSRAGYA